MAGRRLVRVDQRRPDLRFPFPQRFAERLGGATVRQLRRRAKYLLIDLDTDEVLLIHLGMSGTLRIHRPDVTEPRPTAQLYHGVAGTEQRGGGTLGPHDHVVFDLDDATRIVFADHRRFGMMDLFPSILENENRHLTALGPEPLGNGFNEDHLNRILSGRSTPIKAALLDQRVVAGLGNIYVCEALFRAGISPRRLARTIPGRRAARLAPAVRDVLTDAIAAGGKPKLFSDEIRQPCSADNVGDAVAELCERDDLHGIFHWAGFERVSRYELGCRILRRFGLDEDLVESVSLKSDPEHADRPADLTLELGPLVSKMKTEPASLFEQMEGLKAPAHLYKWVREHGRL